MSTLVIVFVLPAAKQLLCRVKRGDEMGVQKLITQAFVEAFDEGVLRRFPWLGVLGVGFVLRGPRLKMLGTKLTAVVAIDCLRASYHSNCGIKKSVDFN